MIERARGGLRPTEGSFTEEAVFQVENHVAQRILFGNLENAAGAQWEQAGIFLVTREQKKLHPCWTDLNGLCLQLMPLQGPVPGRSQLNIVLPSF